MIYWRPGGQPGLVGSLPLEPLVEAVVFHLEKLVKIFH